MLAFPSSTSLVKVRRVACVARRVLAVDQAVERRAFSLRRTAGVVYEEHARRAVGPTDNRAIGLRVGCTGVVLAGRIPVAVCLRCQQAGTYTLSLCAQVGDALPEQ